MTDVDPRDAVVAGYIRARTAIATPPELAARVREAIEITTQSRPRSKMSWAWVPAVAAAAVVLVAVGLAWYGSLVGSSPAPSATPSATTTATATATPPTPSTAATPLPSVEGLAAGPVRCTEPSVGFALSVPDGWYTNVAASEIDTPSCLYFATRPFGAPRVGGAPAEAQVVISIRTGAHAPPGTVTDRRELTINGLPALRLEVAGAEGGVLPPDQRQVAYLIGLDGELPSESTTGTWLLVETSSERPGEETSNVEVLDQIAATVEAPQ